MTTAFITDSFWSHLTAQVRDGLDRAAASNRKCKRCGDYYFSKAKRPQCPNYCGSRSSAALRKATAPWIEQ